MTICLTVMAFKLARLQLVQDHLFKVCQTFEIQSRLRPNVGDLTINRSAFVVNGQSQYEAFESRHKPSDRADTLLENKNSA